MYLISDHLKAGELRNMVIALNEQFPVSFWRRKIPDMFFENRNIRAVNWPLLAVLARSKYIRKLPGVLNRQRLLDMIRPRENGQDGQAD